MLGLFKLASCAGSHLKNTPNAVTITPTPPPPKLAQAQQEAATVAKSKTEGIEVPSELKKPHPIIAGWLSDHKEQQRRDRLDRSPYRTALPDWTDSDRRQHRILDAIFRAVEKNGLIVKSERRGTFQNGGDPLPPSEKEQAGQSPQNDRRASSVVFRR